MSVSGLITPSVVLSSFMSESNGAIQCAVEQDCPRESVAGGGGGGNLEATEPGLKVLFPLLIVLSLIFLCLSTQGPVSQEYVVLCLVARSKGKVLSVLNRLDGGGQSQQLTWLMQARPSMKSNNKATDCTICTGSSDTWVHQYSECL